MQKELQLDLFCIPNILLSHIKIRSCIIFQITFFEFYFQFQIFLQWGITTTLYFRNKSRM